MKLFIYSRKSKFTGKGESIENQITLCRDYILSRIPNAKEEDITPFEDEGFSGKNTARPQFQKMMELVRKTQVDYIVCYRLDRISRNVGDFSGLIEELGNLGVSFVCIKEQFDTSSPMGRAMMYIASVFAQLERETIAERVRDNMMQLAKSGRWLGGVTPTGFCSEQAQETEIDGKLRTSYQLIPIPEELRLVGLIFDTFLKTESVAGTARFLNSHRHQTKTGKEFGTEAVKFILRNPVYAVADAASTEYFICRGAQLCLSAEDCDGIRGLMPFNRSYQGKRGRAAKEVPEWIIATGKHRGILPGRDWVQAQALLDEKQAYAKRNAPSPVSSSLLPGVLRCGGCGARMRPRIFSGYVKADGQPAFYYSCTAKEAPRTHACTMKNANGYELEQAIYAKLLAFFRPSPSLYLQLEALQAELGAAPDPLAERQAALQAGASGNERKIQNLVAAIATGESNPAVLACIKKQIHSLQMEQQEQALELAALLQRKTDEAALKVRLQELEMALLNFSELAASATSAQKKQLIASVANQIAWDGENAQLYL